MGHIHFRTLIQSRFRIMKQKNETLSTHRNLRPLQFRRRGHRTALLSVFVGDDSTVFPSRRCHQERRRTATSAATASAPLSTTLSAGLSHDGTTECDECYKNKQNCNYSHYFVLHALSPH